MPPLWLTVISWVSLSIAFLCAGAILYDLYVRGYRQHMWIMEAVWPITALYLGSPRLARKADRVSLRALSHTRIAPSLGSRGSRASLCPPRSPPDAGPCGGRRPDRVRPPAEGAPGLRPSESPVPSACSRPARRSSGPLTTSSTSAAREGLRRT